MPSITSIIVEMVADGKSNTKRSEYFKHLPPLPRGFTWMVFETPKGLRFESRPEVKY